MFDPEDDDYFDVPDNVIEDSLDIFRKPVDDYDYDDDYHDDYNDTDWDRSNDFG